MIQYVTGNADVAYIECTNPRKDRWRIRWNITVKDDSTAEWVETDFGHRPTPDEIKDTISGWYNAQTDSAILSGFKWRDMAVWLSSENQFNYKAAYDLAVQSGGDTLPVTFKLGTDETPVYHTFDTVEELGDFYSSSVAYVQQVISDGWAKKDSVDYSVYE